MKITDYEHTRFVRYESHIAAGPEGNVLYKPGSLAETLVLVDTLAEATGVWTPCPKCFAAGTPHGVLSFFTGVALHPDSDLGKNNEGKPVRWAASGTSLADLTLTPSIQIQGGCNWHGWITNGETVDA